MKTVELTGAALDWAVAKCENLVDTNIRVGKRLCKVVILDGPHGVVDMRTGNYFRPSTDWSQGGPIIEQEHIDLIYYGASGMDKGQQPWEAQIRKDLHYIDQAPSDAICGPTPLIAAMRCYVASKLGDEVDVPEEPL